MPDYGDDRRQEQRRPCPVRDQKPLDRLVGMHRLQLFSSE